MKVGKNLLPWVLIASSVLIASLTYHRQARLDQASAGSNGAQAHAGQAHAGQSQAAAEAEAKQHTAKTKGSLGAAQSLAAATSVVTRYQCDDQKNVQATYVDNNGHPSSVVLTINGQNYPLYGIPSQAGRLYATEQGINPGQGMRWHVQGLEARLVSMTLDHTATPDKEQLLMRCQQPV